MASALIENLSAASALATTDLFYVKQAGARGVKATGTQLLALVGTAYVPLAGGTMTGALTLPAGAVGTPSLMFTGAGATDGFYSPGANEIALAIGGGQKMWMTLGGVYFRTNVGVYENNSALIFGTSLDTRLYRDAAGTLAQRNGTNAQTLRVYGTYTSGSVYERLSLTHTATTGSTIAVETLGATADLDLTLTPAGTGKIKFGTHSALAAETVTGYITIKDAGGTTRKLAVCS